MSGDVRKESDAVSKGISVPETLFGLHEDLQDLSKRSLVSAFLGQTLFYGARRARNGLQADISSVSNQIWAHLEGGEGPSEFELNELKLRCAQLKLRSDVAKLRTTRYMDLTPPGKLEKHERHLYLVEKRLKLSGGGSTLHSHEALQGRIDVLKGNISGQASLAREGRKVVVAGGLTAVAFSTFAWFAIDRHGEPDIAEPEARVQSAVVKPPQDFPKLDVD